MTDAEGIVESLRQASETKLHSDPRAAVDQALHRNLGERANRLRGDVFRLLDAYEVKTFEDVERVYHAQRRALESQKKPIKKEAK